MQKIIIDTDIGDDIDDAFAIALAARMQEAELVGVTTVFRNTEARTQLAEKLLECAGVKTKVYAGERLPLKNRFTRLQRIRVSQKLRCPVNGRRATAIIP